MGVIRGPVSLLSFVNIDPRVPGTVLAKPGETAAENALKGMTSRSLRFCLWLLL